jgi:hypothetical protein
MNKKFLICLAPLLVTAAFAVMPAVSQGEPWGACTPSNCPHGYKNGAIAAEGEHVNGIAWGNLNLFNTKIGEVECKNVFGGYGENPTGGGRAVGKVTAFFPYECTDPFCEEQLGQILVTSVKQPWRAEVWSPEKKLTEFWGRTGFKGPTKEEEPSEPEFVVVHINCTVTVQANFFGENDAKVLNNGITVGSSPAEVQVLETKENPQATNLETKAIGVGEAKKKLKGEGYGAEELLSVKNP